VFFRSVFNIFRSAFRCDFAYFFCAFACFFCAFRTSWLCAVPRGDVALAGTDHATLKITSASIAASWMNLSPAIS